MGDQAVSQQLQALLDKTRTQVRNGKYKAAADTLMYVETQVRGGEYAAAQTLLDLATEVRDETRGGARSECERFIDSAQSILEAQARQEERVGRLGTGFAPALYLGIHPNLSRGGDTRGAGVLWFATQWIGIGSQEAEQRRGAFVPMAAVESIEVRGGKVSKGAGELIATYAVLGVPGLIIGGVEDYRSEVVIHTRGGEAVHFTVDLLAPEKLRTEITPLLTSLGIPFTDEIEPGSRPGIPLTGVPNTAAATQVAEPAESRVPETGDVRLDLIEALERLAALHRSGALTDDEFAALKAKLVAG